MGSLCIKRFLRTAALLDSDTENERQIAARQASALLREAGLDWTTVLRAGLTQLGVKDTEAPVAPAPDGARGPRTKFDDLMQQVRTKAREVVQPSNPTGEASLSSLFSDVIKGVAHKVSAVAQAVNEGRSPPKEVSGESIPNQVEGVPELIQDVQLQRPTLVFWLNWDHHRYGPMVAHDHLEQIRKAIQQGQSIVGIVAPPASSLDFPQFRLALN